MSSLVLLVAMMLGAAACVGVTGKPAGGGNSGAAIVTPSSVNFGKVAVKTSATRSLTLTNTGTVDLTITKLVESGQGFSVTGLSVNMTVKAGASVNFTIKFAPTVAAHASGTLTITDSVDDASLTVTMDGTGVAVPGGSPAIQATPSSVNFGNVTVGSTDSQTMRLTNTGTADLTISKISASGIGFSQSGLSTPLTLAAGHNTTFTASFKPGASGTHTGSISITSNASTSTLTIPTTGSGVSTTTKLSVNPTSLNFGTVNVGATVTQNVLLTNTGNTNVAISSVAAVGTGLSATGGANATLTPNQSINVAVSFNPKAPGGVTGTLTVFSNAPAVQVALAGTGAGQVVPHTVALNWAPSVSVVIGYNVYRGTVSGGPYTRLNPGVELTTSYADKSALGGLTYYYVVTAIDSNNVESAFSNEASVTVPSP
ncbi:MAG: choice-of-anchor D domain-containing protein [Candidatus Acidiferrales bacterium]